MNQLLILRHAKSDWTTGQEDFDRPLSDRGRAAAAAMGPVVRALEPDLVLCSPSKRTCETLTRLELNCPVKFEDRIYGGSAERLLEVIGESGDDTPTLMIIGHMPGVALLAAAVSEGDYSFERERIGFHYPTAALTVVDFEGTRGRISRFVVPKELA